MKVKQGAGGKFLAVNNAITSWPRPQHDRRSYPGDIIGIPTTAHPPRRNPLRGQRTCGFHGHSVLRARALPPTRIANPLKIKQLQKGAAAAGREGATQLFRRCRQRPDSRAVGTLQFDVVASRLENEYGVQVIFEEL